MSSEWPEPEVELEGFGPCDHDFRCWKCGLVDGERQRRFTDAVGRWTTALVMVMVMAIMLTPLLWLLRVCWSWALGR